MTRVFWGFLLAIWLTMVGTIFVVVFVNYYLDILPPKGDLQFFHGAFAVVAVAHLIDKGEIAQARQFAAILKNIDEPIVVAINPEPPGADAQPCRRAKPGAPETGVVHDNMCYRISIVRAPRAALDRVLPFLVPAFAALLTSFISAALLANYLVRPVVRLRQGLSALANGIFSVRIGPLFGRRRDEIAALGHDFDVTAAKLEELQEGQRRLFHDVSHELRSPLSRMQAAFGLLKKNPAKLDAVLPRMEREIDRLDGLVEEILTLARLGSPESQIVERQAIDVVDLLAAIIDDATFEAQSRALTVRYDGVDSFISRVNGELIYRAIENVMRNAVKYSSDNSTISVTAGIGQSNGLDIAISNQGPYVSPEDVRRIFEPFTRLLENEAVVGHGLGLAITQRAVEFHGGVVSACSNPGGGLTVTLHLPVST